MPFAATTGDRVMACLGLPVVAPFWVEHVAEALDRAENYGGDNAVTRIEGYLDNYEEAESSRYADAANGALLEADVLKWRGMGKSQGFTDEMCHYRNLILNSLFIPQEREEIIRNSQYFKSNRLRISR